MPASFRDCYQDLRRGDLVDDSMASTSLLAHGIVGHVRENSSLRGLLYLVQPQNGDGHYVLSAHFAKGE